MTPTAVPRPEVEFSAAEARRMLLRAQGMLGASGVLRRREGVTGMLHRLSAVQLDTISVLARSHELVPYARLGPVGREHVEAAYWAPPGTSPSTFEYWAHAACLLPVEHWPLLSFRRRECLRRGKRWHQVSSDTCKLVLHRLRNEGPLTANELGGAKAGGPWWDWSEVKIAVEWLLDIGEVICVRRVGWRRVYDLPERVLPAHLLGDGPHDEECRATLVRRAGSALGVATRSDLADYYRMTVEQVDSAAPCSGLVPVRVEGWHNRHNRHNTAGLAWADPDALASTARGRHRTTLLSPFDPVVWDRARTQRVFGFTHRLEAYVPRNKRVHGYFAMPLLTGGHLVGRVDPGREGRTLVAKQLSLERASAVEPMAAALREAAEWVGCDDIRVDRVQPAALAEPLRAALRCG